MQATPFRKILIANRGEIALRIMRTARALGYRVVAVYSSADADARHVREADQAVHIGAAAPAESYLNIPRIIEAAHRAGADAIHPGYGFLAENARFAAACHEAKLVFIGPSAEAIDAMGNKATAKHLMQRAGVPCIPGYQGDEQDEARLLREAEVIGYPVMIKATAGGGGRGIRRVRSAVEFSAALRSARSEAGNAFGDARVLLEKAILSPRHVEVQVFADRHGNAIHLGERDCSVQRRHQKLIEEAPSPAVTPELRERMGAAAVLAAKAIDYEGAGTVEYLLDASGQFYFMEMNTRLQVEHPVTEFITGLDLVELQLRVAAGERLPIEQQDVRFSGHAIEVRLCSEDPNKSFAPQSGRMHLWQMPAGVRAEHALESGAVVPAEYDSMIAKLIGGGATREDARRSLVRALEDVVALGMPTNQTFLASCLRHPVFVAGEATTDFIDGESESLFVVDEESNERAAALTAVMLQVVTHPRPTSLVRQSVLAPKLPVSARFEMNDNLISATVRQTGADQYEVTRGSRKFQVSIENLGEAHARVCCEGVVESLVYVSDTSELLLLYRGSVYRAADRKLSSATRGGAGADGKVRASMTGRIVAVHAAVGDVLVAGQAVITIEAMKMEHTHRAPVSGRLVALRAELHEQVMAHRVIAELSVEPEVGVATGVSVEERV